MGGKLFSRATKVLGDGVLGGLTTTLEVKSLRKLTLTVSIMEVIVFVCVLLQKRQLF